MKAALMLGVNPNSEREKNDFYATDPWVINKSIAVFKEIGLSNDIWECACGHGHLADRLREFGYNVFTSDVINRGSGVVEDFLNSDRKWEGDILTNPPFKLADKFIEKTMECISEGRYGVFLLKVQFLETMSRAKLFKRCGLKYVIVNSERICCAMNGEFDTYFKKGKHGEYKGGTQLYCWFVFEKGYVGEPTIKWI